MLRAAKDGVAGVAVVGLCGLLGWLITTGAAADRGVEEDPSGALTWREHHPYALQLLAEEFVGTGEQEDLVFADVLARDALTSSPVHSRALSVLGIVAESRGEDGRAEALMTLAAQRSLRDRLAHEWLLDRAMQRGDHERAWFHADVLLRSQTAAYSELAPKLVELATLEDSARALSIRLAASPGWRRSLLKHVSRKVDDPKKLERLFVNLQQTSAPASVEELGWWVQRFVAEKRYEEAVAAWTEFQPPERRERLGPVYNSGFDPDESRALFQWSIPKKVAGEAVITRQEDDGHALRVAPSGTSVRGGWIKQLLVLPRGEYVFTVRARREQGDAVGRMAWTLSCGGSRAVIASTGAVAAGEAWRTLVVPFRVPAQDCRTQWLRLDQVELALNHDDFVPIWFDDATVRPAALRQAGAAAPRISR